MNRIEIENNERELIAERLLNLLPHGSGINGDWTIFQKSDKNFYYASNFYHSMDSNGFYDRCYDFTVKYQFNGKNQFSTCKICDGKGYRNIEDFRNKYHPNMTRIEVINFLNNNGYVFVKESDTEFKCWNCGGSGSLKIKEFSLININLHGQYIKSDQYGLSDYLYQTCDIMED